MTLDTANHHLFRPVPPLNTVLHNSFNPGSKLSNVSIVYTPWSNLKKTSDMAVGQVGYHSSKLVKKALVEKKDNTIIKMLEKTRVGNRAGYNACASLNKLQAGRSQVFSCILSLVSLPSPPGGKPPRPEEGEG